MLKLTHFSKAEKNQETLARPFQQTQHNKGYHFQHFILAYLFALLVCVTYHPRRSVNFTFFSSLIHLKTIISHKKIIPHKKSVCMSEREK